MKLAGVLRDHKARAKKDSNVIMTCVFKKAAPNSRTRPLDDDLVVGNDPGPCTDYLHTPIPLF